jgi:hypothetical protein
MTYLVIERFFPDKVKALYQKFAEQGRMLPEGVVFVQSWIDEKVEICYQIMESDSIEKLWQWALLWKDYADFEIIPVINSEQARNKVLNN